LPASQTDFLDRDGTINVKPPEGANQRGIALGRMNEEDLAEIHAQMLPEIGRQIAIYHCPHHRDECDCRKPRVGMFRDACRDHPEIDFERSVMIGDSDSDMEAGRAIGARVVRIGDGPAGDEKVPSRAGAVRSLLDPSTKQSG
jgi:histidinol phosphatase-like enzyme